MITLAQGRLLLRGGEAEWATLDTPRRAGQPMPPPHKPLPAGAAATALPPVEALELGGMSVKEAIGRRRSRRRFTGEPLRLDELAFLLWATQGLSRSGRGEVLSKEGCPLRPIPSAGTRNPFETYVLARNVLGLERGLHLYAPVTHELLRIREHDDLVHEEDQARVWGKDWPRHAPATLVWTTVPHRVEWRYGTLAAKLIAQESGHLGQNLYLAAEALGLGTATVGIYKQDELDRLLRLPEGEELVVYLAPVGRPDYGQDVASERARGA